MTDANALFIPHDDIDEPEMTRAALACIDGFTACFNARDLNGMDAHLHFPHVILSGEQLVIWERPGQLPAHFFDTSRAIAVGTTPPIRRSMSCW
ncbi:hypothetical protein [Paraburkholderia dilworthii]|uniref:hypothetical protein n=1 Tax=Paraburkholderia dilworthii TaxID=948106 RepID=UPI0003F4BA9D|nr:hypothetical protein [Paraburkholderia dilworthii]